MKKVKNVTIVLLSIIVTGCSYINSERQENNSIAIEQQTEGENQSIQSIDTAKENDTPVVTDNIVDYSEYFQGISGCAVIYDESSSTYSFYIREKCETEVSPLSTFKIVSALAGLESNVLENETSTMEYSGVKYPIDTWNSNLTLKEAFETSCVWYFRQVVDMVGQEDIRTMLKEIQYGNCDISEWNGSEINPLPELNGFWLESSLKISPKQQIVVLNYIFGSENTFNAENLEELKSIMYIAELDNGCLYGKTGSGTEGKAWFVGFIEENDNRIYFAVYLDDMQNKEIVSGNKAKEIAISILSNKVYSSRKDDPDDAESIAAVYRDIYEEAVEANTLGSLETLRRIAARLGENGYVAVDSKNQVDMAGAEQAIEFCKAVEEKKNDKLTIIVIKDFGFRKFDLETENGNVIIVRGYYQYDKNGCLRNISTVKYPADIWQYTEEGYLLFEGSFFSTENYVLTLSDTPEHTVLRVLPLDDKCRELNRKYILPVGYEQNNIFLTDWNEEDFGDLDFYDIFDSFYPILYKQSVPYVADENLEVGAVYRMPEEIFENVIMTHFNIDREMLRSKTTYFSEDATYEYRPRGFYEVEYPDIPYPEVVDYTENQDGTITLIINAVYPNNNTSAAYSHKTVIRPINEDGFQYVSNQMISLEDERDIWWHSNRLTMEEWLEIYGSAE